MRQRNKKREAKPVDAKGVLRSRSEYRLRKLVGKYGSHEAIQSALHVSVFAIKRTPRKVRAITIPEFQGWFFSETPKYWAIIAPKGGSGKRKECETPAFRGDSVSVIPSGNPVEATAKKLITLIKDGARATSREASKGVGLRSDSKFKSKSGNTLVVIRRVPPANPSKLALQTWQLAYLFVHRYQFHLGVSDSIPSPKGREVIPFRIWSDYVI